MKASQRGTIRNTILCKRPEAFLLNSRDHLKGYVLLEDRVHGN